MVLLVTNLNWWNVAWLVAADNTQHTFLKDVIFWILMDFEFNAWSSWVPGVLECAVLFSYSVWINLIIARDGASGSLMWEYFSLFRDIGSTMVDPLYLLLTHGPWAHYILLMLSIVVLLRGAEWRGMMATWRWIVGLALVIAHTSL